MPKHPADQVVWRLGAIRIDPDMDHPELYCLILEGAKDRPLLCDGRILFFTELDRAEELIAKYGSDLPYDWKDLEKPFFHCDIAEALHALTEEQVDQNASILDAVNFLLDLVECSPVPMPASYKEILFKTADHCTFSKDMKALFEQSPFAPMDVVNAMLWCIGAIVVSATIV